MNITFETYQQDEEGTLSVYALSNDNFTEQEAWEQLPGEYEERAEFIEFDSSVASHYGYENCAIFHV